MNDQVRIYLCEDSIDGIFSGIYEAWSSRYGHNNIKIQEKSLEQTYNIELFSEYITVETNEELSAKVAKSVKEKIKGEAYEMLCRVALSNHTGKADLIYRFMILGFHFGPSIMEHVSDEVVSKVYQLNRYVGYEAHHLLGFVRFTELDNGILLANIHPKNNVLTLIAPHFSDRLPEETFIIFDEIRKKAVLHAPGRPWIMTDVNEGDLDRLKVTITTEDEYEKLWKTFFQHIAIKERTNKKLQRNMLPLRFRDDMTEFKQ
ncbi:MAG: hypothetical protein K0S47_3819 [Herbinix sp.]|jgi:probable DNA metabolism protein|nr:hypothetical protein [Herbinix sp.]